MTQPLDPSYFTDESYDIKKRMDNSYRQSLPLTQQFWNEADIDVRFNAGDQTLWSQIFGTLPLQNRRTFMFNRCRRITNMVTGYQRRNRKSTIFNPVEGAAQEAADQYTKLQKWIDNESNGLEVLSDAFQGGACITGFNLLSLWLDYRHDPISGDPRVSNLGHNGAMVDPTFKNRDLSDANFIWTRKWMSKRQAASLMPERAEEIKNLQTLGYRDDKFMWLPENYQYSVQNMVPYDEYWYLDSRDADILVDTETGEVIEWNGEKEALDMYLYMHPQLRVKKMQKPTVKLAISISGKVFYDGPNPLGIDKYPFVGVFGYFEPQIPYYALKMQGIIRGLRDAQFIYNRKMVIMNDILESQINSGLKFKESALKDPRDAFLSGQGRMLAIRDSASMDDVDVIKPPGIDGSMMELAKLLGEEISQISGVNEELLGSAMDDKAGVLSMLRQGAGLTTLQVLFDQLDLSQKYMGEIWADITRANFSKGKLRKILGQDPVPEFETKAFQKYECVVEEGVLTSTQRQMQFQQLLQVRELGIPVPSSVLLDSLTIQNKRQLQDAIAQEEQQQAQQAQAQAEAEMQKEQVLANTLNAKAESDKALAAERMAKIDLDNAMNLERIARAQEDRDNASLARIKAAKELEGMNIEQIEKMLSIVSFIQAEDRQKQEQMINQNSR
jgi:hypothetical protein